MPLIKEVFGNFELAVYGRNRSQVLLRATYDEFNAARQEMQRVLMNSPLSKHWFSCEITDLDKGGAVVERGPQLETPADRPMPSPYSSMQARERSLELA